MKRFLIGILKYGLPLAIVTWLIVRTSREDGFDRLWNEPKDWAQLTLAGVLCLVAIVVTFIRWYLLVRALGLPFRLRDAFRLGFLGYLFNFVTPGSVGGDLFKAIFIAREHPGRRAAAVASVIVDRIVGLHALFLVASAALFFTDAGQAGQANDKIRTVTHVTWLVTLGMTAGAGVLYFPAVTEGRLAQWLTRRPRIGPVCGQLLFATRTYLTRLPVVWLSLGLSVVVHCLFATAFYCIALALPGDAPSLAAHLVIVPLSMLVGILPLMMNALGLMEGAVEFLYQNVPGGVHVFVGQGLLVSLTYRLITIVIACIGAAYYLARRRGVDAIQHPAESENARDFANAPIDGESPRLGATAAALTTVEG